MERNSPSRPARPCSSLTVGVLDPVLSLPPIPLVYKIPYAMLDGSAPENVKERNRLFDISKRRGVYPQVFVNLSPTQDPAATTFVGTFDEVSALNECQDVHDGFRTAFAGAFESDVDEEETTADRVLPVDTHAESTTVSAAPTVAAVSVSAVPSTTVPAAAAVLPEGWIECVASDGSVYYANKTTKVRVPMGLQRFELDGETTPRTC